MCYNRNNIKAFAEFGQNPLFVLKILGGNKILTPIKGHNSIINLRKLRSNTPNLDLVNSNAYLLL